MSLYYWKNNFVLKTKRKGPRDLKGPLDRTLRTLGPVRLECLCSYSRDVQQATIQPYKMACMWVL